MMFTSSFSENEITEYVNLMADFIKAQGEIFAKSAAPLSPPEQEAFKPFFDEGLLKTTLFFHKKDGPIESPDFLRKLHEKGVSFSIDGLRAITLLDVVVTFEELQPRVQFHELVHAVQYRKLGRKQFANKYLRGLLRMGKYERIPLEANAHLLDEAYAKNPSEPFSVEAEVQKWINENRF
jgi:hypothetical protein